MKIPTFIVSKEDFRRLIHGSHKVEILKTNQNLEKLRIIPTLQSPVFIELQDISEPVRSRIVSFTGYVIYDQSIVIYFTFLCE